MEASEDGSNGGTEEPTTASTTPTSSMTADSGAVCSNGVVDEAEVCDDGNDDPDDGCNESCQKPAEVEWTYTHDGVAHRRDEAFDVAIDGAGRIIVAGFETNMSGHGDMLLIVLAPDGSEMWARTFASDYGLGSLFYAVATDAAGNIYAGGTAETDEDSNVAVLNAYDPDGSPLWAFSEPPPGARYSEVQDLVVAGGALFTAGRESLDPGGRLVVRRHALTTGAATWTTRTQVDVLSASGDGIAVVGDRLFTVGAAVEPGLVRPLIAEFSLAGDLVHSAIEDRPSAYWNDIAPIGLAGDLVLSGHESSDGPTGRDAVVRRVGPGLDEQWTWVYDHGLLEDVAAAVAVGPDEAIFVGGYVDWEPPSGDILGARLAPDGTLLWTHTYDNPGAHLLDLGYAAAFGSTYVILAGTEEDADENYNVWVRRLKAD